MSFRRDSSIGAKDYHTAAIRELKGGAGLHLDPITSASDFETPVFTTIGMTDVTVQRYTDMHREISDRFLRAERGDRGRPRGPRAEVARIISGERKCCDHVRTS